MKNVKKYYMKIGDKLLCKRNLDAYITKGKKYEIKEIYTKYISIKDNDVLRKYSNVLLMLYFGTYIWDYFYTKEEIRILKLE
jgi:hypothetical protein